MAAVCMMGLAGFGRGEMFEPQVLLWEAFVSAALMGWGFGVMRTLRLRSQPLAVSACAGVSAWLLLGGWMNLAHAASRRSLVVALGVGFLLCGWELGHHEMRDRIALRLRGMGTYKWATLAAAPIAVYVLLMFAAHVRTLGWNKFDDQQAYMAFADKAAAMGSLQSDPFSDRRIKTGMGGGIFLNVTMLAGADDSTMGYIDAGFGYLIYVLAVWSLARAMGLSRGRAVGLLYAVPLLTLGKVNLTIVYLSTAYFLVMLILLLRVSWEKPVPRRVALLLGLLLGAASTVKSTNIPFTVMLIGLCAAVFAWRVRSVGKVFPLLLATFPLLAVVLPWTLKLHRDQGTYFFPNLGGGYYLSAFGTVPQPGDAAPKLQSLLITMPLVVILSVAALLAWGLLRKGTEAVRIPVMAFLAAGVASVTLVGVSLAGEGVDRFTLPVVMPCLLLLAACVLLECRSTGRGHGFWIVGSCGFLIMCLLLCSGILRKKELLYNDPDQMLTVLGHNNHLKSYFVALDAGAIERHSAAVRRAQYAVPEGQTILEATETAYGYDWQRNTVYIADYLGMAGLPPGPPVFGTAEQMRAYLLSCGVHYVILERSLFQPLDFEQFRREKKWLVKRSEWKDVLGRTKQVTPFGRMEYLVQNHVGEQLKEIAAQGPAVYDDGRVVVFSLDR